jgi:hypothetical protein
MGSPVRRCDEFAGKTLHFCSFWRFIAESSPSLFAVKKFSCENPGKYLAEGCVSGLVVGRWMAKEIADIEGSTVWSERRERLLDCVVQKRREYED